MKNDKKINIIILFFLVLGIAGYGMLNIDDLLQLVKWYSSLLLLGLVAFPIANTLFKKFEDSGYIFSKILGILLASYLMWLCSSFKVLKFSMINGYICILVILIISFILFRYQLKNDKLNKININKIIRIEMLFFIILLMCSYIKGFNSEIMSTEKFMDYGYMNILNRNDYMPAEDLWLAGKSFNYYYYGQYLATFICKVSNVSIRYGYNLMLGTLLGLSFFASFSIVYNLLLEYRKNNKLNDKRWKVIPYIGGSISALANTIAGNMHYVLYGLLFPILRIPGGKDYWFPDSTRFIGYNPDRYDKTIHEFPSYSFVLGDLHAHVINLILVFLLLGLLVAYIFKIKDNKKNDIKSMLINPYIPLIGVLIGVFKMTNYWDYPIYMMVSFLVLLFTNIIIFKKIKEILKVTLIQLCELFAISYLISLPFALSFDMIASKISLVNMSSLIYQLFILWGLPTILVIHYIILSIKEAKIKKIDKTIIMKYLGGLDITSLFMIIIGLCAIGLIVIPEIVYVKDIYAIEHARSNTMFKLTYQAYIMFGLCFGYMMTIILYKESKKKFGYIVLLLFTLTLGYGVKACDSWFGDIFKIDYYNTTDGTAFLTNYNIVDEVTSTDDLRVINWLNMNANNGDVILETYGDSYTFYDRVSTFTGLATPLGWLTHEHLWRSVNSSADFPLELADRMEDVDTLYSSSDKEILLELIDKYNIKYIIVGYMEREKFADISEGNYKIQNEDVLKSLGKVVLLSNDNGLSEPTYIIEIDRK